MHRSAIRLCVARHGIDYNKRNFYTNLTRNDTDYIEHALHALWNSDFKDLNPAYFPKVSIQTQFGEFIQDLYTFKTANFFLKLVGDHFVLIHNNKRKTFACSHSQ
jgi:hypothetical protein